MNPLIEIKTVPIEIKVKTTNAKLEYVRGTADMEISRADGGLNIKSRPIKVNIDTFEARNSMTPTPMRSIEQRAEQGKQAVYTATAKIAQEGRAMIESKSSDEIISQIAQQNMIPQIPDINIEYLPSVGPDISWEGGEMSIRYEMDKLNFDWRMQNMEFTFTPGDVEFTVVQNPDVVIEYIGGPLYVPPSSDPNYEPVDIKV